MNSFSASRQPPRFVPTLTEVVQWPDNQQSYAAPAPAFASATASTDSLQAHLVQRVMLRVDVLLSQRVNAAVAEVVSRQMQLMQPALHQAIEDTVYTAVCEAMVQELSGNTGL
jgi:hypothetical protein